MIEAEDYKVLKDLQQSREKLNKSRGKLEKDCDGLYISSQNLSWHLRNKRWPLLLGTCCLNSKVFCMPF